MEEADEILINLCADLVSLKKMELFPFMLLQHHNAGEWVPVRKICQESGIDITEVAAQLVATWLPDPLGDQNYAVIIFYDVETLQSFAARYNRRRLLDND